MFEVKSENNRFNIYNNDNLIISCFCEENAKKIADLLQNDYELEHFWDIADTQSTNHFLVIDGSSMLATAYYGTLPKSILYAKTEDDEKLHYSEILQTKSGIYTNAVFTMLKSILNILENQKPSHMVVVFDKSRDTFRRDLYTDYKANRKPTPAPLTDQFLLMQDILNKIGIKTLISDTCEADDLAGSVIAAFKDSIQMEFMTKDHDYLQLIDDNVKGWMVQTNRNNAVTLWDKYHNSNYFDANLPEKVVEFNDDITVSEVGVHTWQIADFKGIAGDSSDNIPGIKGVGPKTASALLLEYNTIEGIYHLIDSLGGNEQAEKALAKLWKDNLGIKRNPIKLFKEQRAMAFLSKNLATIRTDVEIPSSLDYYKINIDYAALQNVLETYEFGSLFGKVIGWNQLFEKDVRCTESGMNRSFVQQFINQLDNENLVITDPAGEF